MKGGAVSAGSPKKILSLICLNPNKFGSYEEFELLLAKRMSREGYRHVKVFVAYPPTDLRENYKNAGADMDFLPVISNRMAYYQQAITLFRKHRPDVLHLSFFPFLTPMVHVARLCGIRKVIFTDHSSGLPSTKKWGRSLAYRCCNLINSSGFNHIIAVSNFVRDRLIKTANVPEDRISVVYNGVNPRRFCPGNNRSDSIPGMELPGGRPIFTLVSHMIMEKGIVEFLAAAEMFIQSGCPATFVLVGDGKNMAELKNRASEMDLRGRVVFAGLRSDVESVLQSSDIFVYPSVWEEAFGLANVEAMACGLPVISTRTGGIPEVVEEDVTGWLVAPRDADALAEAMRKMAASPEAMRRYGEAGRKSVLEKFNMDRQVEEILKVYRKTLEE